VWTYIASRLLLLVPVVLLVTLVTFSLSFLIPGDPAAYILGENADQATIDALHREMGFDQPLVVQYARWLINVLRGDLGRRLRSNEPVATAIAQRLGPTVELALLSLLIGVAIALPLGVLAATRATTWIDRLFTILAMAGLAMPGFWLAILLIMLFSVQFRVLPPSGYSPIGDGVWGNLRLMILPAFTLGVGFAATVMRQARASMVEVLWENYVRTARAKGLREIRVLFGHALRNAMIPVATVIGLRIGQLLGGAVVIETVFAIPGIGRLAVDGLLQRDFPVTQAVVLVMGAFVVLINLTVDLAYGFLDPRIRYR
jgi:peptide/nickel transport system permease protein